MFDETPPSAGFFVAVLIGLFVLELQPREALIQRTAGHQFIVRPAVDDSALIHHHDASRVDHSGEPMSNDDRGALPHDLSERLLHVPLALGIERTGGFIQ